ncbi:MAG: 4Fe-4S ferredoxin iron-sulfur binding domain protein [Firmicutes bacterium]|nr:4Fe-4S ferredoxin iron-sulfur binding domain protein [Bacillota bacterium]
MGRKGLFIDYEYCTGCHTCEVACKQENNYPAGRWGIKVNEIILESFNKVEINYLPFPTELCNLCAARIKGGELPACVKHCQASCMKYGDLTDLVQAMEHKAKTVLFAPK